MTTSLYLGGPDGSRLVLPAVPTHSDSQPSFRQPEPSDHLADVHSQGYPWPGQYPVERDEVRQSTRVVWRGSDSSTYPWGKRTHHEQLTYEVEDDHPEVNRVQGIADSTYVLKNRTIAYRGKLEVHSDRTNFYYSYTRKVLENGRVVRQKTWQEAIPRDHPRSSMTR